MIETALVNIRKSQVRQVNLIGAPCAGLAGRRFGSLAKEGKFKTETVMIRSLHVPRVVPPLGLKIGMVEMIARKLVTISRCPQRGG